MAELENLHNDDLPLEIDGVAEKVGADQALELIRDIEIHLKDKLPKQDQGKAMRVVREVVERRSAFFSGPQPPPDLIAEYERIAPGWGIRILEMGEREQLHRHSCDKLVLQQNELEINQGQSWLRYIRLGQIYGFIAFLVVAAIGAYALSLQMVTVACVCFGTFVLGVVSTFVKGSSARPPSSDQERNEVSTSQTRGAGVKRKP